MEEDFEDFLQQVEGDKEMRGNINLYKTDKDKAKAAREAKAKATAVAAAKAAHDGAEAEDEDEEMDAEGDDDDDEDEEEVRLDELLDDLDLSREEHAVLGEEAVPTFVSTDGAAAPGLDFAAGGTGFEGGNLDPDNAFSLGSSSSSPSKAKAKGQAKRR
jgi:hypothetical protein